MSAGCLSQYYSHDLSRVTKHNITSSSAIAGSCRVLNCLNLQPGNVPTFNMQNLSLPACATDQEEFQKPALQVTGDTPQAMAVVVTALGLAELEQKLDVCSS